jgi:membrane protease YdiL (CAAX protease family)
MSAPNTSSAQQSTANSPLMRLVARRPVLAFLLMAYAIAWALQFVAFQFGLSFRLGTSISVIFGLALPALLVTAAISGKAGVLDLLGRVFRWRVGVRWYLIALVGLPVATLLVASAFLGLAPLQALVEKWPLFFTIFLPELLLAVVLIQIFEESAWTGFVQDTLQERHGPLLASIMVAPAFALFHLMSNILEAGQIIMVVVQVAVQAVASIFLRVVIMWLYNSTGRSILIVAFFHSSFNTVSGSEFTMRFIRELIAAPVSILISLAIVAVVAVLVTIFTRGRLAYEPGRGAAPRPAGAGGVAGQPRVR